MLDTATKIWSKLQEFVRELGELKAHDKKTDREIGHLRREFQILARDVQHHSKIQDHQGVELATLQARVKKLESEKHGLATKLGRQKALNERLTTPKLPLDGGQGKKPRSRRAS